MSLEYECGLYGAYDAMKLFYPLTPKLALIITDKESEEADSDIYSIE